MKRSLEHDTKVLQEWLLEHLDEYCYHEGGHPSIDCFTAHDTTRLARDILKTMDFTFALTTRIAPFSTIVNVENLYELEEK